MLKLLALRSFAWKYCNVQTIIVNSSFDAGYIQKPVGAYLTQNVYRLNKHLSKVLNHVDVHKTTLIDSKLVT